MDLAQSFADLRQSLPEGWLGTVNRHAPRIVMAVLVLLIARELASVTWTVLSDPAAVDFGPAVPAGPARPEAAGTAGYASLSGWRPFGEPPDQSEAPPPVEVVDAPDTTLNLTLHGVNEIADSVTGRTQPDLGTAAISSGRGQERLYAVGEPIDGASGARLHSVYFDRVLIDRSGRLETLRLPIEFAVNTPTAPLGRPGDVGQPATSAGAAAGAGSLRDALSDNAAALTEVIRPTPHMEGGQMIGFRLAPGRNRDAFNALGLQPGDVMTEVNGLVMNDPRAAAQVFSALSETNVANVTIVRDGTPQVLTIDLSTVESIVENSQ